jgi:uridine kinase
MTERDAVLRRVAEAVPRSTAPVLVAVDGVDGAGKSVFAGHLAARLRDAGRTVVHASVDDFHRPRAERYRRGRDSPAGFWLDSFDYDRLRSDLLDPLSRAGSRRYRTAVHDLVTDQRLDEPWQTAADGTVLVLDGLFLHRDELAGYWDLSVFLDVPFAVTARRMAARDGTSADPDHPTMRRYVGAQQLYFESCRPAQRASIVIDNTDWDRPVIRAEG